MNTVGLFFRSIVISWVLMYAGSVSCSASESRRGIVRQTRNPSCPNLCDVYYLQPDSGFVLINLYTSPGSSIQLVQYVDTHVEVTGVRGGCSGCTVLDVGQITILSTTGVRSIEEQIPTEPLFSQNYPNPFNPKTTFRFQIPARQPEPGENSAAGNSATGEGLVTVRVYDVLGREVATILNEQKAPGPYTVSWDAGDTPAGVYFFRLQIGRASWRGR